MVLQHFFDFLLHQERKEYDMPQAIMSAIDFLDGVNTGFVTTRNAEDFTRFFCSELAAAALEASGAIRNINASEVTPADLCRFSIYDNTYYQLKGADEFIGGFNTLEPENWGE